MKPVALIILVLIVHSESFCTRTLYIKKKFNSIADEELKSFLKRRVKNIRDTDCTMTYQVRFDDEEIPFYPFLINRQDKKVFGVVKLNTTQPGKIKYNWTKWDSKLFKRYYEWCHENMESDRFEMPPKPRKPLPEPLECSL